MRRKAELVFNIITLILVGILIAIQLLTDTNPVLLTVFVILFGLQAVALLLRIKGREK